MLRKKLLCVTLAVVMVFSMAACGKKSGIKMGGGSQVSSQEQGASGGQEEESVSKLMVPGTLYQLNSKSGEEPIIRGVRLDGNVAGSSTDGSGINGKSFATEKIRFAFELNEYVIFYFDSDTSSCITAYFFEHQDDPTAHDNYQNTFLDDCAASMQLYKMDDLEWGAQFVDAEEHAPGYYDLVFVYENKTIAKMLVKLYAEGELAGKSDADIEKLMSDEIAAGGR